VRLTDGLYTNSRGFRDYSFWKEKIRDHSKSGFGMLSKLPYREAFRVCVQAQWHCPHLSDGPRNPAFPGDDLTCIFHLQRGLPLIYVSKDSFQIPDNISYYKAERYIDESMY
jgi:hypothetical protein